MKVKMNDDGSFAFQDESGVRAEYADAEMLAAHHGLLMQDHDAVRAELSKVRRAASRIEVIDAELAEVRRERAHVEAMIAELKRNSEGNEDKPGALGGDHVLRG